MSYAVLFDFATGLERPVIAPVGTLARIREHVAHVEKALGLRSERYLENPAHWTRESLRCEGVDDAVLCREARAHNEWVLQLFRDFGRWHAEPAPTPSETITNEDAQTFWHALARIEVPRERWTETYYVEEMGDLYEVLRGRPTGGVSSDVRPLSAEQAGAVIRLIEPYVGVGDPRLEVPKGHDHLATSDDYVWCSTCGRGAYPDDARRCRRRGCEARKTVREEDEA